jgi:predicted enzyme related to lactoylglutathione lyase
MAQMLQGVSVVWLPVTDIDRAVGFYEGTLGLSVRSKQEQWAELDAGEITIGLNGREEETPGGDGGAVVAFRVAGDIDAEVERLASQGVTFPGGVSDHPWGKVAPFKDPDGNDLQLYEAPQG